MLSAVGKMHHTSELARVRLVSFRFHLQNFHWPSDGAWVGFGDCTSRGADGAFWFSWCVDGVMGMVIKGGSGLLCSDGLDFAAVC